MKHRTKTWLARLLLVFPLCASCTKGDSGRAAAPVAAQLVSGTLKVRILPETPVISSELQAGYNGPGAVTYLWKKNGQTLEGEDGPKLKSKVFSKEDRITVSVRSDKETGTATVIIQNSPPVVTSVPFSPEIIHAGVDIVVTPIGSDADGDGMRFEFKWSVNGNEIAGVTPVLKANQFKKKDRISLAVTPYDSSGPGQVFRSGGIIIPNAPPEFSSQPGAYYKGQTYTYDAVARDPDGDSLVFELKQAPKGMNINSTSGKIIWQPGPVAGTHIVEITATDPDGAQAVQQFSINTSAP